MASMITPLPVRSEPKMEAVRASSGTTARSLVTDRAMPFKSSVMRVPVRADTLLQFAVTIPRTVASAIGVERGTCMGLDIDGAVREACLWLPEAEEFLSHGSPNFRVRGKTFATYVVNHHGDGRVALWLNVPPGSQETHVRAQPRHFFVPPYVGPRGWLGVLLDSGLKWPRIAALVREAYEKVAPAELRVRIGKAPVFKGAVRKLSESRVDPFKSPRAAGVLKRLRAICRRLPGCQEGSQFGHAAWLAGKKTFAIARPRRVRSDLAFLGGGRPARDLDRGSALCDPALHGSQRLDIA